MHAIIALWAKLWFISTSWRRYAELITGCKWTSQQSEEVKGENEQALNVGNSLACWIISSYMALISKFFSVSLNIKFSFFNMQ